MRKQQSSHGYTVVELLVGFLAGAVIAITAGTMLFYAYLAWARHNSAVELQRDGSIAIDMITRKVRELSETNITVSTSPGVMTITSMNGTSRFSETGNDLVWDPDTSTSGDDYTVISGNLTEFTPTKTAAGITVILTLQNSDESMTINSVVAFRN